MGKFILKRASSGTFYFVLKAENSEVLLRGESYCTKSETLNAIALVRLSVCEDARFQTDSESNDYVFTLTDDNGEIIGTSELHTTMQSLERAKKTVREVAAGSVIIDQT